MSLHKMYSRLYLAFHTRINKDPDLQNKWIKIVNRSDWIPTSFDGICIKHFDPEFIAIKPMHTKLKRELKLVLTIYNNELQKLYDERPSLLLTQIKVRKEPKNRNIPIPDELKQFLEADMVDNWTRPNLQMDFHTKI